ncbi:MAG: signal peptide peptidase SppA [Clostridia bacterium]|nr:signal peptide peptidase SppA [Clostridia bacterium]
MRKRIVIGLLLALVVIPLLVIALKGPKTGPGLGNRATSGETIGVIYVDGPIVGGRSGAGIFGGAAVAGSEDLMNQLKEARKDSAIKAVLIRINSPGGSAPASQEIGDEIDALKQSGKKVVVSMGDVAASGGYWLAAKADKIVANPATMTGSIGVIMQTQNLEGLFGKLGIGTETIKSGPHKDIGSPNRQMTPEERQILQGMVNDIYEQFVDVVATGRKMDREKVRKLADGRIYTGRQAKQLGLVDELGNFHYAVRYTAKLVGIEGEPTLREFGVKNPFGFLLTGSKQGLLPGQENGLSAKQMKALQELFLLNEGRLP